MRTNIVLDETLVKKAFKISNLKTKKDLINTALKEFVINHSRKDIRELLGKVQFYKGYDYKALREG